MTAALRTVPDKDAVHEQRIREAYDRYERAPEAERPALWREVCELIGQRTLAQVKRMERGIT